TSVGSPAGAAAAAGAVGGAETAVSNGARSASVDHRYSSIVSGSRGAAPPITEARRLSAASSPDTIAALISTGPRTTDQGRTADQARTKAQAPSTKDLLPVAVIGALGAAQPLGQPLEFLVFQFGTALAHVHCHHTPSFGTEAGVVHAIDPMT